MADTNDGSNSQTKDSGQGGGKGSNKGSPFLVVVAAAVLVGVAIVAVLAFANWSSGRVGEKTANDTSSQEEVARLGKKIEALEAELKDLKFSPPPPPAYAGHQPTPVPHRYGGKRKVEKIISPPPAPNARRCVRGGRTGWCWN